MKRKLLALLLPLALLAGCGANPSAPRVAGAVSLIPEHEAGDKGDFQTQPQADAAIGNLGANLLRAVRRPGENTLLSPLSVTLALSMTANGAAGDTRAEFEALLGTDVDALNENAASLLADYLTLEGSTQSAIANSLWVDEMLTANDLFLERCAAFYEAGVYQADLGAERTRNAVNDWIDQVTRGMIPQMLQKPLAEDTALLLVNALYLKNTWAEEFDPNDTNTHPFTAADGTVTDTDFLSNGVWTEGYFRTETAAGVVLPYDDGRLAFVAVLPDGELDSWLEELDGETFSHLLESAEDTLVYLRMPKFEAEWGGSLSRALKELGLESAFDPSRADFSALGSVEGGLPLFVGSVDHRAKIEVNEKGTEAAAATVVAVPAGAEAEPMEPVELCLDRPFCYAVVDLERGVPLFLGTFETVE
ncbi:serpin family protein [uncultured Flavonifractor sp.]|uniref:serpin family protein n=1 Tax=uncultured Flavonifractor sp. TaxID=1193534 RepID=UPI00261DD58D|nr:serpin family protein [uncultured Flavonifractor sp.]